MLTIARYHVRPENRLLDVDIGAGVVEIGEQTAIALAAHDAEVSDGAALEIGVVVVARDARQDFVSLL